MKFKKTKLCAIFILVLGLSGLQAQETLPASGGNHSGTNGSVSYTVGQIAITTLTGTNGIISQGVQQPFEIFDETGMEEASGITLICTAFPNPTTGSLTLKIADYELENLTYQLFDVNGRLLDNKHISDSETVIQMAHLNSAMYFLKVTDKKKEIKTFRIFKR